MQIAHTIGNGYTVADATQTLALIAAHVADFELAALKADEAAVQFRKMGVTDAEQRALALAADSRGRTRSVSGRARLELS